MLRKSLFVCFLLLSPLSASAIDIDALVLRGNDQGANSDTELDLVIGRDQCPKLWSTFVTWHSSMLALGKTIEEGEQEWIESTGYIQRLTPNYEKDFLGLDVQPVRNIKSFEAIAVVCGGDKANPFSTRFIAAIYLDQNGHQNSLLFNHDLSKNHHNVHFGVNENDKYFGHAIENKVFELPPADYHEALDDIVNEQIEILSYILRK